MEPRMDERLTELEVKLTFAEDLLDELNRTVFRQQEEIDFLRRELARLAQLVREWTPPERIDPREEIPPHY
jgi:SlyX protein